MDIFKCKKCGSDKYALKEKNNGSGIATGLYCAKCGFWHKWVGKEELYKLKAFLTKKELSTAEKLLYIVEKGAVISRAGKAWDNTKAISIPYGMAFIYSDNDTNSRIEAINAAYAAYEVVKEE